MISKTTSILLGGLLAGTLLTGVGAGVTAAEFLSFEIERITPEYDENIVTEELTYEMSPGEIIRIFNPNCTVKFDESVPQGTVQMSVEYNPQLCYINYWTDTYLYEGTSQDESAQPTEGTASYEPGQLFTFIELSTYDHDSLSIFSEHKDKILAGLKEGRLVVYEPYANGDNSVKTVMLNPADEDRLSDDGLVGEGWTPLYG